MNNLFTLDRKGENNGGQVIWSKDQLTYLVEQYNLYHSIPNLAKQFNVSSQTIRNALRKSKVKILTLSELHTIDYPRDSNFFEKIDSPAKAYWFGFLMADGTVGRKNEIRINLKWSDRDHLQKFYNAIGANKHNITKSKKTIGEKEFEMGMASIKDNKLHDDLCNLGCVPNKTNILEFPKNLPDNLYSHFIRGYFDGDGSIYYTISGKNKTPQWRVGFTCGSFKFLEDLRAHLGKDHLSIEYRENYGIFCISGNKQLISVLEYIYKDSSDDIELYRKRQIYNKFLLQSLGGEPEHLGCE